MNGEVTTSKRILRCDRSGDRRFSALDAKVTAFGKTATIEKHYQMAKRFGEGPLPERWTQAKGKTPAHLEINGQRFKSSRLSAWYALLWLWYLDDHPDLVEYASEFDAFEAAMVGQERTRPDEMIRDYVKNGRERLLIFCRGLIWDLGLSDQPSAPAPRRRTRTRAGVDEVDTTPAPAAKRVTRRRKAATVKADLMEANIPSTDLDGQIMELESALDGMDAGPDRVVALNDLASALDERYCLSGILADLLRRIALLEQAATACDLGGALMQRHALLGDPVDLDRVVALFRDARDGDLDDSCRSGILHNLGIALGERALVRGNWHDLEDGIENLREAILLAPPGGQHAKSAASLAGLLNDRIRWRPDLLDLDEQVMLLRQAIEETPPSFRRAQLSSFLGLVVGERFHLSGDPADFADQTRLLEEFARVLPDGHTCATSNHNLGVALHQRYKISGDTVDLARSIALLEEALALTSRGAERATCLRNLAVILYDRYHVTGDTADAARAVDLVTDAVRLASITDMPEMTELLAYVTVTGPDEMRTAERLAIALAAVRAGIEALAAMDEGTFWGRRALPQRGESLWTLRAELESRLGFIGDGAA